MILVCPPTSQLGMTLLLTCVVIYMYTVIAFNFFRKFYREPGQEVYHCESMARVGRHGVSLTCCSILWNENVQLCDSVLCVLLC